MFRKTLTAVDRTNEMNTVKTFNKEKGNIRQYQVALTELKVTVTELKSPLERFSSRLGEAGARVPTASRPGSGTHPLGAAKRMKETEDSLRDLRTNIEQTNICIIGPQEGGEKERGGNLICRNIG